MRAKASEDRRFAHIACALVLAVVAATIGSCSPAKPGASSHEPIEASVTVRAPLGLRVRWIEPETGNFGVAEAVRGDERPSLGAVDLPRTERLLVAVDGAGWAGVEGALDGGWCYAAVDTIELEARRSALLTNHFGTPWRAIDLATGAGPSDSKLEVAVECDPIASCALVDDDLFARLKHRFHHIDEADAPIELEVGDEQRLFAARGAELDAPVRPLLPHRRTRPAFRPNASARVTVPPRGSVVVRAVEPVRGRYAPWSSNSTFDMLWSAHHEDLLHRRTLLGHVRFEMPRDDGSSLEALSVGARLPSAHGTRVALAPELVRADAELVLHRWESVDDRSPRRLGSFVDARRGTDAQDGAVHLDARGEGRRLLRVEWRDEERGQESGEVRTWHHFVAFEQVGVETVLEPSIPVDEPASIDHIVVVDPMIFDGVDPEHRPVHEVLIGLRVIDDATRASVDLTVAARGPGRHAISGVPAGCRVVVASAHARAGGSPSSALLRLDLRRADDRDGDRSGATETRVTLDPFDRADHSRQRLVFAFPSDLLPLPPDLHHQYLVRIEGFGSLGSSSFGSIDGLRYASDSELYLDRKRGDWSRASIGYTAVDGRRFVATLDAAASDAEVVRAELVPAVRVVGRLAEPLDRGDFDRDAFYERGGRSGNSSALGVGLWGPWDPEDLRPVASGWGPMFDARSSPALSGGREFEFEGLERGASYVLAPGVDIPRLTLPLHRFTIPSDLSGDEFDLGVVDLTPKR